MNTIQLTDEQMAALIRHSDNAHVLDLEFGSFGARLRDVPGNQWAFDYLEELNAGRVGL